MRGNVNPKVELFDDHAFVLVKTAHLRGGETTFEEEIRDQPVGLFFGHDWIVTLAVEEYFAVLDEIGRDIEAVEDRIIDEPDTETLEILNSLRRELLSIRRIVWPTRDAVSILARGDADQVQATTEKYYRDVYDHLVQHVELVETYRDLASGARDIYLNTLSQSTNEVMKRLTVVATIILPLTFVVGVYGMNFGDGPYNMPELGWRFGYPAVLVGMALTAAIMLQYFRSEGWL